MVLVKSFTTRKEMAKEGGLTLRHHYIQILSKKIYLIIYLIRTQNVMCAGNRYVFGPIMYTYKLKFR